VGGLLDEPRHSSQPSEDDDDAVEWSFVMRISSQAVFGRDDILYFCRQFSHLLTIFFGLPTVVFSAN
jgi:hypothetical protein